MVELIEIQEQEMVIQELEIEIQEQGMVIQELEIETQELETAV